MQHLKLLSESQLHSLNEVISCPVKAEPELSNHAARQSYLINDTTKLNMT